LQHDVLTAPYVLEYAYKRSVGPIIGRFLGALRDGRLEGIRTRAGKVLFPPAESDPDTGETLGDFVELPPTGTVVSWAWVSRPLSGQPLDVPFAWALIRLDGADSAFLHAVDAGSETRIRSGARVKVRFREARKGEIRDIACFDLVQP
jgi:uncharacterized OB-fold protein